MGSGDASVSRLFVPSLVLAAFSTQPPNIITSLLLIEIGLSFGVPVGVSGQLRTVASIVGVFVALSLGAISLRFRSKSMVITGSILLTMSAIGSAVAWDFESMLLAYSVSGIGITMTTPMINTIIGDNFPQERRPRILGLSAAGTSIAYMICSPLVSYISGTTGWRAVFTLIMLPVSLLSLITLYAGIPSDDEKTPLTLGQLLQGYRAVLSERSAVFCLIGTMLCWTMFLGSLTYMMSFYRQRFLMELGWASVILSVLALSKTLGHLTVGKLIEGYGRKKIVVGSIISVSVFIVGYLYSPNLWVSLPLACMSCLVAGYMHSSVDSLNLEQVSEYRGSMMSLSYAFYTLGGVLGAGLGGLALLTGGYNVLAAVLGLFGFASCLVFHGLTKDAGV
jgi:predicted MFS family arabinose efflux permease